MKLIKVNHYQKGTSYIGLWKYIGVAILIGFAIWGMWQVVTYDFCPMYYGIKCLPN